MSQTQDDVDTCRDLVTVMANLVTRGASVTPDRASSSGDASPSLVRTPDAMLHHWADVVSGVTEQGCSAVVAHVLTSLTAVVEHVAAARRGGGGSGCSGARVSPSQPSPPSQPPRDDGGSRARFFERKGLRRADDPGMPSDGSALPVLGVSGSRGVSPTCGADDDTPGVLAPPVSAGPPPSAPRGRTASPNPATILGVQAAPFGASGDDVKSIIRAPKQQSLDGGLAEDDCAGFKLC